MKTRIYTYQQEVRGMEGVIHFAGEQVHQTWTRPGGWRDTEILRCISGNLCRLTANCFCNHCKFWQEARLQKLI